MDTTAISELRSRGEITIPKKIRETVEFEEGEELEFIPIGKTALLLTPRRLDLEEARKRIQKILKQTKTSPEEVLKGLRESRKEVFQKYYGKLRSHHG